VDTTIVVLQLPSIFAGELVMLEHQ